MGRLLTGLTALLLLASGCGGDQTTTEAGDTGAGGDGRETTTMQPPPPPGGELVRCESPAGFTLARPEAWSTNSGDVVPACSQLHPEPFEVPEGTDERVAAITVYIDPVPFVDVAAPDPERDADRAVTTIDGLQAVRLEYDLEEGLWPAGTPITLYAVDLSPGSDEGPGTLFLDTVGLEGFDYEQNQVVLDRVARTLEVTLDGVTTDPTVVARYEGGGGGFAVEGAVSAEEACLRIPPDGDRVCTHVPGDEEVLTVQLTDLEPILAGVTGEAVFRVAAERRDGSSSTVLPASVGGDDVRGFAFTFDLDAVSRLTWFDVTGAELGSIEPGG